MQDVKKCPLVWLGLTASPPAMRPASESSSRPGGSGWAAVVCCLALVLPLLVRADSGLASACHGKPCTDGEVLASQQDGAVQFTSFSTCVDGDPDFIVGVQGMQQPLCFRLEGQPGQVIRLLQDPDTGVVVNAQITQPVPGLKKTYLGAVLISRRNFQVVARLGHIAVNSYKFLWGPTSARLVHGHRILIAPTLMALTLRHRNVTLVVKRHMPEEDQDNVAYMGFYVTDARDLSPDTHGLLAWVSTTVVDNGPGAWVSTTVVDNGPGAWVSTTVVDNGPGAWVSTTVVDNGPGAWVSTTVVDNGPGARRRATQTLLSS
ncbi:hypothetical protein C0Q70_15854 [Pomacea canaliculata]|uniref:Inter-alpha-trypsin inhibitor heavy chain C-terminal domain-containing protein n=1 Tax=Pomacea canaliculata TaxID=400727 RepID=A0A2T7NW28_POMCA|nr:hypothetical protein C0Q70_15854 [Pomacea canaliculata]